MYDEQKAAQIAAWFLNRAGGSMPHLKLMKLMYLAERESMRTSGFPMTGDRFVSMTHGPVLSCTLSHIRDEAPSAPEGWDSWISDLADHKVGLVRQVHHDVLDRLSRANVAVLEEIWAKFGHMGKYEIRDYTHDPKNCPEWRDPNGSSFPIHYRTVFMALGHDHETAVELANEVESQHRISKDLHAW